MKIDKFIASTGIMSRRKAIEAIRQKRITINNKPAKPNAEVKQGDVVKVGAEEIKLNKEAAVYIAYNKPKGIICTSEKIEGNIIDAVNHPASIYPVGRLDKDSEGLILLTNNGELNNRITHPDFEHEKEYVVTLNLPVRKKFLDEIQQGVELNDSKTMPCIAWPEPGTKRVFRIVLKQGLNRQIRRMCNMYRYQVVKLQRVRVMNIELGKLNSGAWRNLDENEINELLIKTNIIN